MIFLVNFEPDPTNEGLERQRRLLPEQLALVRVASATVPAAMRTERKRVFVPGDDKSDSGSAGKGGRKEDGED